MKRNLIFTILSGIVIISSCGNKKNTEGNNAAFNELNISYEIPKGFDIQGHRIARGIAPENSLFAIPIALEIRELTTLELDLAITKDLKVILSHDPWMSSVNCDHSNDDRIMPYEDEKIIIFNMPYEQVREFRCGGRRNKHFLEQRLKFEKVALLDSAIIIAKNTAQRLRRPEPQFNIEIKSKPDWDNFYTPTPDNYAKLVVEIIEKHGIENNTIIQSFDPRSLEAVKKLNPSIRLSLLGNTNSNWETDKSSLSFLPDYYSPYYKDIDKNKVEKIKAEGVKVIPYTVNDSLEIGRIIESGCDGIISDYPDRVARITKMYR